MQASQSLELPWKRYIILTCESLLTFYIATFSLAMFFLHSSDSFIITKILLVAIYFFIVAVIAQRIYATLSIAALMLLIPIAPLLALIIVVTLFPVLDHFI